MELYRYLAKATEIFHWLVIAFLLVVIPVQIFTPGIGKYIWITNLTMCTSQIIWMGCPLVALENAFLIKVDPTREYRGSFICHYMKEYFDIVIPPWVITAQMVAVFLISTVIVI